METGNKISQYSLLHLDPAIAQSLADCHCQTLLTVDGISLVAKSLISNRIQGIFYQGWSDTSEQLSSKSVELAKESLIKAGIDISQSGSNAVFLATPNFSLVPLHLFKENNRNDYLPYTTRLYEDDTVQVEYLKSHDIAMPYSIPYEVLSELQNWLPDAQIHHSSKAFLGLLDANEDHTALLNVESGYAEFGIMQKGKLLFYNYLPYQVEEDLLYLVLFALEQNKVLPTELTMQISGKVSKADRLYTLLSNYIFKVNTTSLNRSLRLSSKISPSDLRRVFTLTNVLA